MKVEIKSNARPTPLGHRGYRVAGGTHLREHLVQPLQRSVQMNFHPTRRAGHVLAMVLGTPTLDEAHTYGTVFGELVHRLVSVVHALREQLRELLIVEYFQCALGRDFTHGGRVEPVMKVTVARLHEDRRIAQTFGEHFAADVVEVYALADVAACVLDCGVPVDVGHAAETESIAAGVGVGESIDDETCTGCLERFSDTDVEFVVSDGAPVLWLVVCDRCHVWRYRRFRIHGIGIGSRTAPIF